MLRFIQKRERGQVLMMTLLLLPILLGMTGMAVDIGAYASDRRSLQNVADSVALAASQELCATSCTDYSAAQAAGEAILSTYNLDLSTATVTITGSGGNTAPKITVQVTRPHEFAFMQIVGIQSKSVAARAAAVKVSFGGSDGIVPWSVTQATVDAAGSGVPMVMKYDADGADTGNFGAIRIDGSGANVYGDSVMYGSQYYACAVSALNCSVNDCFAGASFPNSCAEDAPECDGPDCIPQTGNVIGPTRTGVDFRMNNTSTACDTFEETFTSLGGGAYNLDPDCNPWIDGPGKCTGNDPGLCSRRVIIIPVVDSFGSGTSDPTTIQRFALVYLEGYDASKCQGNVCEIKGRFVRADVTTGALSGTYDPNAAVQFARLSE